jgi:hypothetical protein
MTDPACSLVVSFVQIEADDYFGCYTGMFGKGPPVWDDTRHHVRTIAWFEEVAAHYSRSFTLWQVGVKNTRSVDVKAVCRRRAHSRTNDIWSLPDLCEIARISS